MAPYVRSFDISKCYTKARTAGDFLFASINIWFEDMINFIKPLIVLRDFLGPKNPVAGLIVEIIFFLYVDPEIREVHSIDFNLVQDILLYLGSIEPHSGQSLTDILFLTMALVQNLDSQYNLGLKTRQKKDC